MVIMRDIKNKNKISPKIILIPGEKVGSGCSYTRRLCLVESGGAGGLDINFVMIETEPRCGDANVQG